MSFNIKQYNFEKSKITSISKDTYGGDFLWIAFTKHNDTCQIKRVSSYDLNQIFYTSELNVNKIIDILYNNNRLYVLVEDDSLILNNYNRINMSLDYSYEKSTEIIEYPIAINKDSNNNIYILFPGNISGSHAEIHKLNPITLTLIEKIELSEIQNVKDMTIDTNDNIWLITYTDPTQLIRVYKDGDNWINQITNIE